MIGVFDSGLGGLTVVSRVRAALPKQNIVFFADQAHVPYGDRTDDDLHALLERNLAWLDARGCEAIVMGCNTSCAIADRYGWPKTSARVFDLIDAAIEQVRASGVRRIGVVATAATIRSGVYGRRLREALPDLAVNELAAPTLVPMVESGHLDDATAHREVTALCAKLPAIDAIVLACTHYPLLDRCFAAALGASVARIDPAVEQARRVLAFSREQRMADESGETRYVTNGDGDAFRAAVRTVMGDDDAQTEVVQ